jgi:hypothetical protein
VTDRFALMSFGLLDGRKVRCTSDAVIGIRLYRSAGVGRHLTFRLANSAKQASGEIKLN